MTKMKRSLVSAIALVAILFLPEDAGAADPRAEVITLTAEEVSEPITLGLAWSYHAGDDIAVPDPVLILPTAYGSDANKTLVMEASATHPNTTLATSTWCPSSTSAWTKWWARCSSGPVTRR